MTNPHVFVILARGKSKGVLRKNLREVGEVPLVVRSVTAAIGSSITKHVYVSTDDAEIAAHSRAAGAEVIHRPDHLAADDTSSEDALIHALHELNRLDGTVIMIQPTSPFLRSTDLIALSQLSDSFDSALTVTESHRFIWRAGTNGSLDGVNHDPGKRLRRQDIHGLEFAENGAAYLMNVPKLLEKKHRFFGKIGYVKMPLIRSFEIDTEDDLVLANVISAYLTKAQP